MSIQLQRVELIWLLKQRVRQLKRAALKTSGECGPKPIKATAAAYKPRAVKPVLPEPKIIVDERPRALQREVKKGVVILRCRKCWIGFVLSSPCKRTIRRAIQHFRQHATSQSSS